MDDDFDIDTGEPLVTTNEEETHEEVCSCSGWSIGFFLLLLLFLVAVGLAIWWGIFYFRNRSNVDNKNGCINFKNPRILVQTNNSVQGTWDSTGNVNDVIILYASLNPPIFDSTGAVITPGVIASNSVTGNETSVTLSGLQEGLKYYLVLVASNKNTCPNYQSYTQIIYMSAGTPPSGVLSGTSAVTNTFSIEHILQVGKIQLTSSDAFSEGGTGTVEFNQAPTQNRSLWFYNTQGQLEVDPETTATLGNVCLYNDNGTLAAGGCTGTGAIPLSQNQWTYFPFNTGATGSYSNHWCLSSTVGPNSTPSCMKLNNINSSTNSTTVSVTTDVTAGDAWVNAFEHPS